MPEPPKKEGFVFKGWLYNDKEFDIKMKLEKNITLKAIWEEEKEEIEEIESTSDLKKCPNNYKLVNNKCERRIEITAISCENGYTLKGGKCTKLITSEPFYPDCPSRYTQIGRSCYNSTEEIPKKCPDGYSATHDYCRSMTKDPTKTGNAYCIGKDGKKYIYKYEEFSGGGKCYRHYMQAGPCPGIKVKIDGTDICIDPNDFYFPKCDPSHSGYSCSPGANRICNCYKIIPQNPICPTSTNTYHNGKCYKVASEIKPVCTTTLGTLNTITKKCERTETKELTYRCQTGYKLDGNKCYKMEYTNPR